MMKAMKMTVARPASSDAGRAHPHLGGYEVQKVLQKAIFGEVLLAQRGEERVVLKAVSKELAARGLCRDGTAVFENHGIETRVLRAARDLPHRNLLALLPEDYQVDTAKTTYTAMPYLAGGELFDAVQSNGAMGEAAARRLCRGLARGLDHLHRKLGFSHNDVSLENVLLTAAGVPVICDFGLAMPIGAAWSANRRISGKLPYQAPEIYFGTATKSAGAGDVFSLGVTLFVLLTGIPPFDLPDPAVDQRYSYIQMGRLQELLDLWGKDISGDAVDLLTAMLAHDPRDRIGLRGVLAHPWLRAAGGKAAAGVVAAADVELSMDESGSDDDDDFEMVGPMELDGGATPAKQKTSPARAIPASPRRGAKAAPTQNFTASPDSVFSFERAYRQHRLAGRDGPAAVASSMRPLMD